MSAAIFFIKGLSLYSTIPRSTHSSYRESKGFRSFIHIENLCYLLGEMLYSKELINEFHSYPKDSIYIIDLLKIIFDKDIFDKKYLKYEIVRKLKYQNYLIDPKKVNSGKNFHPAIFVNEGLGRVIDFIKSYLSKLPLFYSNKR